MLHEMGHSLAFLGDEYTTLGATSGCNQYQSYPENIETERNVFPFFGQGSSQYIKWRVWIDSTTPIATPTNSQYQNAVPGAFQGADVNCLDLYRPTFDSKMRSYGRPFEQINTEQL